MSRLEIVNTGRRRRWPISEKLRIVEESFSGTDSVSATARRHGISNQLLFGWRRAFLEGRLGSRTGHPAVLGFVPARIVADCEAGMPEPAQTAVPLLPDGGRMEIALAGGIRITVRADVDADALRRVLAVVSGR